MTITQKIGFIGSGQMAEALARGFVAKGIIKPDQIRCYDVSQPRVKVFTDFGAIGLKNNQESSLENIMEHISENAVKNSIFVSIAAGITIKQLESYLSNQCKIARLMPNTPCLVGEMAGALATNKQVTKDEAGLLETMFSSLGKVFVVDEKQLNAITGLSGSGPAYVYQIIEALSDGGVRAGLPRDVSTTLAAQTVLGASKMVLDTNLHPAVLKDQVTSPGGTTIAGVHEMEKNGVRVALMNAVLAATKRAEELSQ